MQLHQLYTFCCIGEQCSRGMKLMETCSWTSWAGRTLSLPLHPGLEVSFIIWWWVTMVVQTSTSFCYRLTCSGFGWLNALVSTLIILLHPKWFLMIFDGYVISKLLPLKYCKREIHVFIIAYRSINKSISGDMVPSRWREKLYRWRLWNGCRVWPAKGSHGMDTSISKNVLCSSIYFKNTGNRSKIVTLGWRGSIRSDACVSPGIKICHFRNQVHLKLLFFY